MIDLQGAHDLKVSLVDVILDTDVEIGFLKLARLYKCERLQAFSGLMHQCLMLLLLDSFSRNIDNSTTFLAPKKLDLEMKYK